MERVKEHWIELMVGAFVLVSPWFLGFSDITLARWGNVICGLILILVNIWAICGDSPVPTLTENVRTKKLKNSKSRETN
jgi:hypothetical protein